MFAFASLHLWKTCLKTNRVRIAAVFYWRPRWRLTWRGCPRHERLDGVTFGRSTVHVQSYLKDKRPLSVSSFALNLRSLVLTPKLQSNTHTHTTKKQREYLVKNPGCLLDRRILYNINIVVPPTGFNRKWKLP